MVSSTAWGDLEFSTISRRLGLLIVYTPAVGMSIPQCVAVLRLFAAPTIISTYYESRITQQAKRKSMPPSSKRWDIAPVVARRQIDRLSHLHPLLVQILFNRGVTDPEEADAFLNGRARFDDPFRMKGVPAAVTRIRVAIRAGESIVVYGDFDADGVTSTALLVQALTALGGTSAPTSPIAWMKATASTSTRWTGSPLQAHGW